MATESTEEHEKIKIQKVLLSRDHTDEYDLMLYRFVFFRWFRV